MEIIASATKRFAEKLLGHDRASKIFTSTTKFVTKFSEMIRNNPLQTWRFASASIKGQKKFRLFSSGLALPTNGSYFLTFKLRPITALKTNRFWQANDMTEIAIVLQGPIEEKKNFTLETVRLYRRNFPKAEIILSTWENTNSSLIQQLEAEGAKVLLNRPPTIGGIGNANFQMVSSHFGLEEAKKLGYTYALKTRTDQRLMNPLALSLMKNLLSVFPLHDETRGSQKERIISMSFGSFAYRLYGLTDMLQYGNVDDLLHYWNGNLDLRDATAIAKIDASTPIGSSQQNIVESYFCSSFLNQTGWHIRWTIKDYWSSVSERFCVVDASSLDLIWPKYSAREDRWRSYDESLSTQEIDFAFWTSIPQLREPNEEILKLQYSEMGHIPNRESPL